MTPSKAIALECRFCQNTSRLEKCESKVCRLNDWTSSPLRRIKAHCLTCVPEQNGKEVQACTGRVIGARPRMCPLHLYRLGHNPKRAGIGFSRKEHAQAALS